MNRVRIKICGVTRAEDALAAVRLGADALGFNFWPGSKRHITPAAARVIGLGWGLAPVTLAVVENKV